MRSAVLIRAALLSAIVACRKLTLVSAAIDGEDGRPVQGCGWAEGSRSGSVMAGLVPAIHVFLKRRQARRGCPA
jgi:hypothetical protein